MEYITCKSKLVLEKDGYRYSLSYNQLLKGSSPKKWGKSNPFSVQNLRVYLERENATCYVPDQIFDCTNVRFVCECGNEYEVALNNFLRTKQYFCSKCGKRRGSKNHIKDSYIKKMEQKGFKLVGEYLGCKHLSFWENKEGYILATRLYRVFALNGAIDRSFFNRANPYVDDNFETFIKDKNLSCKYVRGSYTKSHGNIELICKCGKHYKANAFCFRYYFQDSCPSCASKIKSSYENKVVEYLSKKRNNF